MPNTTINGFTVKQLISVLQKMPKNSIVMLGDGTGVPFPLKVKQARFHRHPDLKDTIIRINLDDPDYEYMLANYEPVKTVVITQDK